MGEDRRKNPIPPELADRAEMRRVRIERFGCGWWLVGPGIDLLIAAGYRVSERDLVPFDPERKAVRW